MSEQSKSQAQALYDAWEEGWKAGVSDAKGRSMGVHANPYRSALRKAITAEGGPATPPRVPSASEGEGA